MSIGPWQRIAATARHQHGVVTTIQLLACGLSREAISRAVRAGHLHRLHRGVYAVGHVAMGPMSRFMAAALAGGAGSAVSHRGAAEMQRLLRPSSGVIDVTAPRLGGRSRRSVRLHRVPKLLPDELGAVDGVPCTTIPRTLIDLAGSGRGRELEWAIREADGLGLLDLSAIDRMLSRSPGRRGAAALRPLIVELEPIRGITRSELERRMHRLCRRAALPMPAVNVRIPVEGGEPEVDFVWADARLIIETDSTWHDGPAAQRRDGLRDQALTLEGWRVYRLRWHQIVNEPERAVATIRALLEQQHRLLAST